MKDKTFDTFELVTYSLHIYGEQDILIPLVNDLVWKVLDAILALVYVFMCVLV